MCKHGHIAPRLTLNMTCVACSGKAQNEYYHKNKTYIAHALQRKYQTDKDFYLQHMITRAKRRADKKNLPFNISSADLYIPDICPVLGIRIQIGKTAPIDSSPSLDRKDGNKGYVKGNVFVISNRANRIKNDATKEELKRVYDYMNGVHNE